MGQPTIAVIAMTEAGHFQRLRPLIAGLAGMGADVRVFTDERFAAAAEGEGGRFEDLFAGRPLDAADDSSVPFPCRFVSFAAEFAEGLAEEVRRCGASLVIHDTFAVIGRVVAGSLGVPRVNVCPGHAMLPGPTMAALARDPRVSLSESCLRAVDLLRERHGMPDASPFSYVDGSSPDLNVYCEPPEFLTEAERGHFEPVVFHGSLPAPDAIPQGSPEGEGVFPPGDGPRLYASLGTVVWRYWPDRALADLEAVAEAIGARDGATALIGLGGAAAGRDRRARLERPSVRVVDYADQWEALGGADAMLTHQGLNSTHEAIWSGVPMISRPFFSDQPALSARCRELGLCVPLASGPQAALDPAAVDGALGELEAGRAEMAASLERAREWEARTIASRPAIWERIMSLADRPVAS